jgi:prephenate dehydrogenase
MPIADTKFKMEFKKCRTRNRYSPSFTPDLTALDQHKNTMWNTALASNSLRDMQLFREVRNQYTQAVRKAKASFFNRNVHAVAQTQKSSGPL